jgi:hypothetical protein
MIYKHDLEFKDRVFKKISPPLDMIMLAKQKSEPSRRVDDIERRSYEEKINECMVIIERIIRNENVSLVPENKHDVHP